MNNRYYNTIGTGGGTPGPGTPGGGQTGGGQTGGGGISVPTLPGNFTSNPNTYNGLTPGSVPGTGTGCGCDYTMNCWSQTSPANLQAYPGLSSATCPSNSTQGTTAPPVTYNGTCYNTGCPVTPNTITNAATTNCPGGQQHSQPTCIANPCFKCQGSSTLTVTGYNGNCPTGYSTAVPVCGGTAPGPGPGPGAGFDGTQYNEFVGDERYMNAAGGKQYVCNDCEGAGALCTPSKNECPEGCSCDEANTGMSGMSAQRRFTGQENGDYLYSNWDVDGDFNPTENY